MLFRDLNGAGSSSYMVSEDKGSRDVGTNVDIEVDPDVIPLAFGL